MKNIEFDTIGSYERIGRNSDSGNLFRILIKNELKNALHYLGHFSHGLLFTRDRKELYCTVVKILEVNERNAEMLIETIGGEPLIHGELVDIKPYFPCEEVVDDEGMPLQGGTYSSATFQGDAIGEYLFVNNNGMIQLHETNSMTNIEIDQILQQLRVGDYLRVLWWFHRFDSKNYRNHVMCNPPYADAPRCGIFATRSPVRPNPLASTVVKVKAIDFGNKRIAVLGFDGFEHSVILQIMPHQNVYLEDVKVPKWVEHWTAHKVFSEISKIQIVTGDPKESKSVPEDVYFAELEEVSSAKEYIDTNEIIVENASLHNLKDVSVRIPKGKITVITGVSGSGKSSLAFDTIYYESQKQFMDLVASHSLMETDMRDTKVKRITGLTPSIAIEQKNLSTNPRSTVGSLSGIGEYLRLLFATIGERVCTNCGELIPKDNVCKSCGAIYFLLTPAMFAYNNPEYMCPVCKGLGEEVQIDVDLIVTNAEKSILDNASPWWGNLRKHREKPNANWMKGEVLALAEAMGEDLEVPFKDLSEEFRQQILYGSDGRMVTMVYENTNGRNGTITRPVEGAVNILKRLLLDNGVNRSLDQLEQYTVNKSCSRCQGERLLEGARMVRIGSTRYPETTMMSIFQLKKWCHEAYCILDTDQREKSKAILIKIIERLKKLQQVGLGFINLNRSIPSLSGGEAQRLKIATQFGTGLSNILYVMDEPSKGLHPRDYDFLIQAMKELKKQNNTILIVEHKKEFIQMADYLIEIGPGAGHYGGRLLRAETVDNTQPTKSCQDEYKVEEKKQVDDVEELILQGVRTNNLKNVNISIPLTKFTCVIGVSGSGKSSLISKTLYPAVMKQLGKKAEAVGIYDRMIGVNQIKDICYVSQNSIGKNARSNPGTYTGVFDLIRDFYAGLKESKQAKLTKEDFSFNSSKGQCEECKGAGEIAISMHFMPDMHTTCSKCNGKRYKEHVLKVNYKGYTIADLLGLEIGEVKELFQNEIKIYEILDMLDKVGLSYIKLGQSAATLSGGEAQRIKLAKELCGSRTKDVVYILDEPTTGLHEEDVKRLSFIIHELTSKGATVIVIEHNPRLIKQADYIIEVGPEGGELGGYIQKEGWQIKS